MSEFEKLVEKFRTFPGVGRRQAERFAHYVTRQDKDFVHTLSSSLLAIKDSARFCKRCERLMFDSGKNTECSICSSPDRDHTLLMIVEKDADLNHVERSGIYSGLYFVLGGVLPMRDDSGDDFIRLGALETLLKASLRDGLSETILALSLTPEGEYTSEFLMKKIRDISAENKSKNELKVTLLGRGLSVGSELEYSDRETLRHALGSRKETS